MNPFYIENINGFPTLKKDGAPVNPMMFWARDVDDIDFPEFRKAGIKIFSCFRWAKYFECPYWTGNGQYDFSYYDEQLTRFTRLVPDGYIIPRIFVSAPFWFLDQHPDELTEFAIDVPYTRDGIGSTYHHSFASELWKEEQGKAFRALMKHFRQAPYGDRIIGIHVADGTCGEWHYWRGGCAPDCGKAMAARLGRPVPPLEERDPEYYQAFFSAAVDAIDHFCRIVKEETDYLTAVFYGYFPMETVQVNSGHCAMEKFLSLGNVDIVAAPHSYSRRFPGEDGYFRAIPATLAKHGILFLDESDDRTPLATIKYENQSLIMAENPEKALHWLSREFGNVAAHCAGQWFMDIDIGMFRDRIYYEHIAKLYRCGDRLLPLPRRRVSEVALITDPESNWYYSRKNYPNALYFSIQQMRELTHTGVPFDFFCAGDMDAKEMEKYKVLIFTDVVALSEKCRSEIKKLQKDHRCFIWTCGDGAVSRDGKFSPDKGMEDLTGIKFTLTGKQLLPPLKDPYVTLEEKWWQSPGFLPEKADVDFGSWRSVYRSCPNYSADELRQIFKDSGVHIYSEDGDVISASESVLMIHASSDGCKRIRLPRPRKVSDLLNNCPVGENITQFEVQMQLEETALFMLEN